MSKLPSVSSPIPPDLRRFIDRARESLADLEKQVTAIGSGRATTITTVSATATVYPTPHAPFTLATAVLALHVTVTWDAPGYIGHAWTEVWRAATDDINAAVLVAMVPGVQFADVLDEPGQVYYWTRFINRNGAPGPYSGVAGVGALAVKVAHSALDGIGTNTHAQIDSHLASTANPHDVTKAQVGLGSAENTSDADKPISSATQTALDAKIASTEKGAANGVAPLGSDSKIAAGYLPSYVDDVLEYADFASLPATGETGKIYVLATPYTAGGVTSSQFRWSGSAYAAIIASPGTTDAVTEGATNLYFTAQRVRDAVLTGLSTATNAVITATDSVLSAFGKLQKQVSDNLTSLSNHTASTANPHEVTAAQAGADPAGTAASAVASHEGAADPHAQYALNTDKLSAFAATTSAELAGVISDGTGEGGALVFGTSPTITTPNIIGVSNASEATTGSIGEIITASGSGVSLTSNTFADICSISLTAGNWDVFGFFGVVPEATTSIQQELGAISTISAGVSGDSASQAHAPFVPGGLGIRLALITTRLNVSTTTTVYLVERAVFSISTCTGNGRLSARRVR